MSQRYFPFHEIGFRCNPFRALTRDEWSQVAVIPPQVAQILSRELTNLQIVGEQGVGKTSTLLALKKYFMDQRRRVRYHYVSPGQKRFRVKLHALDVLLLDEMQRLNNRQRARLVNKITASSEQGLRLVCSSHDDLSPVFAKQNKPLLTCNLREHEASFVCQLIERRMQFFSLDGKPEVTFEDQALRYLSDTYARDLRALEDLLYEVFQRRRDKGEITVETIRAVEVDFSPLVGRG